MNLTIVNTETNEPILILNEDEHGLVVTGGDPKMVRALKLDKMASLKEIADYINQPGSNLQALMSEEDPNAQEPELDDRVQPALKILKELVNRVRNRKAQDAQKEEEKKPEFKAQQLINAQVIQDMNEPVYVSLDGDNIGNAVARAEEKDDEAALQEVSSRINAGQEIFRQWTMHMNGTVVEAGGDEGLVKVPGAAVQHIEKLRADYAAAVGATASVGVGKKISESTKARMLAKLRGKNQTVIYDESVPQELELRLQADGDKESQKLRVAMREGAEQAPQQGQAQTIDQAGAEPQQAAPQEQAQPQAPQERQPSEEEMPVARSAKYPQQNVVSKSQFAPELVAALSRKEKPQSIMGNARHDRELEDADYSGSEEPKLSKAMMYLAKHGGNNNG